MHGTPCKPIEHVDCRPIEDILDELAQSQQVQLMADVRSLFGTWPGETDDGFEASIDDLRHVRTYTPGLEGAAAEHKERWSAGNRSSSFPLLDWLLGPNDAGWGRWTAGNRVSGRLDVTG